MQADKEPSSTGMTWVLAIVFAILIGGIDERPAGFAIGAMLGVLLAQVFHLRTFVKVLNERIKALQTKASAAEPTVAPLRASAPEPRQAPIFDRAPDVQPATESAASSPLPESQAVQPAAAQPRPAPTVRPAPPRPPLQPSFIERGFDDFIRWFKTGNPLARIGIVILFFGATFLAKYAADNSLFPIEFRFIALALGALALLII